MKKCAACLQEKPLDDFPNGYKRVDGTYSKGSQCRECKREYSRKYKEKYYTNNREVCLARARKQREDNPEGYKAYLRQRYQENKEEIREKQRIYNKTDIGRLLNNQRSRRHRATELGKMKEKARSSVNHAIRDGKLVKPDKCVRCDKVGKVEGHHKDYSKPLDVDWLCKQCHEDVHHLNEGHESI